MRKYFYIFIFAFVALTACTVHAPLSVGQFNMRYDSKQDKQVGNGWDSRAQHVYDLVNYEGWDIFGVQEVLVNQVNDLVQNLDGYDYVGVGRNDGATKGEYAPIFFKKSRIQCLDKGNFWLSETPDVPGAKGWDASHCRICSWGYFQDILTKEKFWFFNLHMDHRGVVAREESAKLVLSKIKGMCGDQPYILTGDFNSNQFSEAYATFAGSGMMTDAYEIADHRMVEAGSMNYFKPEFKTDFRIDHIFVSDHFKVYTYGVLTHSYWKPIEVTDEDRQAIEEGVEGIIQHERRVISDHHPVVSKLEIIR